jgi:RNA polymerase sigma-70 factor, ECF subfamily
MRTDTAPVACATSTFNNPRLAGDATLVRETQKGDKAAFEELVYRYDRAVLRLALHLMGSEHEAQDIYQEAFLRAYRNLPRFRFECSFYTWMYRIVTNLCLDHLRNRRSRREDSHVVVNSQGEERDLLYDIADSHPGSNPERELQRREIRTRVTHALRKLTPRERMVFELKHYQGLKLRTLGEILNTTEDTVKSTLFRATQKLRKILADVR